MANQDNGRNVALPDENRASWRPQDEHQRNRRNMSDEDERYEEDRYARSRYGQGQSGYGSGRSWQRNEEERDRNPYESGGYGQGSMPGSYSQGTHGGYMQGEHPHAFHPGGYPQGGDYPSQYSSHQGYPQGYQGHQGYQSHQGYQGGAYSQGSYNQGYYPGQQGNYGSSFRDMGPYGGSHGMGMSGDYQGMRRFGQERSGYMRGMSERYGEAERTGGHRGKGPKGYQRSDERIRDNVCEVLENDDRIDASAIEVTVKNGEVMLTGNVDARHDKRLAEDLVQDLPGVKDVQNQLRVNRSMWQEVKSAITGENKDDSKKARA